MYTDPLHKKLVRMPYNTNL